MRLFQLLHELVVKFVPIDDASRTDLASSAIKEYNTIRDAAVIKNAEIEKIQSANKAHINDANYIPLPVPVVEFKDKAIMFLETPLARYMIAILFVVLVPLIQNWFHGGQDDNQDEEQEDIAAILAYRRMKDRLK